MAVLVRGNRAQTHHFPSAEAALGWCRDREVVFVWLPATATAPWRN